VDAILEVKGLRCSFDTRRGTVRAVDGVDFRVRKGEMMALVGESGCGKSVTAQAIMGLIGRKAGERVEGEIRFKGENLLEKSQEEWCRIRGSEIAMVLQDPMTSLNPVHRIGRQVGEVLELHRKEPLRRLVCGGGDVGEGGHLFSGSAGETVLPISSAGDAPAERHCRSLHRPAGIVDRR